MSTIRSAVLCVVLLAVLSGCNLVKGGILSNGDFSKGSGNAPQAWLLNYNADVPSNPALWGSEWVWDGQSKATHSPGNVFALVQKSTSMLMGVEPGEEYRISYTISDRTTGSVTLQMGGNEAFVQDGNLGIGNREYSATLTCPENVTDTYLSFVPSEDFDGSIGAVTLIPSKLTLFCGGNAK